MKNITSEQLETYSVRVRKDIIDAKVLPLLQKGIAILELDVDCSDGTIYNMRKRNPTWYFKNLTKGDKLFVAISLTPFE